MCIKKELNTEESVVKGIIKKILAITLSVIMFPVINVSVAYTAEEDVYRWDLRNIADEIGYDEAAFQSGASYSYN